MIKRYFQIDRKHIVTVQWIIEGYERMGTVSTMDTRKAVIRVAIMPDYVDDMNRLLEYLRSRYGMKELFD
jgi:hypothetical protein